MPTHGMHISFDGGHPSRRLDVRSGKVTTGDVAKAARDAEIAARIFREHPQEVLAMLVHVQQGDLHAAAKRAKTIGLDEDALVAAGGGRIGTELLLLLMMIAGPFVWL